MRYALHAWCNKKVLKQADEIIVKYSEKDRLLDYPEQYPNKAVTIQCYDIADKDIDWRWIVAMEKQFPAGFSVGVSDFNSLHTAYNLKIKAYWLKHINNFVELNRVLSAGACYVYLDQPLFSSLEKIKAFGIPVRWTPNLVDSSPGSLLRILHGTWIRPEDIDKYDIIPGCIAEFPQTSFTNGSTAEESYFKFFHDEKEFDYDLGLLFPEFDGFGIANYLIDPELINVRMNCHQRCEETPYGSGLCRACDLVAENANQETVLAAIQAAREQSQT